jgi:hypothetical protein
VGCRSRAAGSVQLQLSQAASTTHVEEGRHGELGHGHLLDASSQGESVAVLLGLESIGRGARRTRHLGEAVHELVLRVGASHWSAKRARREVDDALLESELTMMS